MCLGGIVCVSSRMFRILGVWQSGAPLLQRPIRICNSICALPSLVFRQRVHVYLVFGVVFCCVLQAFAYQHLAPNLCFREGLAF